jgi:hypothetical protein
MAFRSKMQNLWQLAYHNAQLVLSQHIQSRHQGDTANPPVVRLAAPLDGAATTAVQTKGSRNNKVLSVVDLATVAAREIRVEETLADLWALVQSFLMHLERLSL